MKIVMISDYVNPATYTQEEIADEIKFIELIKNEILETGTEFEYIEIKNLNELEESLAKFKKDNVVIFNWCEYLEEKDDTAHLITEYLESKHFTFTGADTKCLKLTQSKIKTKNVLTQKGIPNPKYEIIENVNDISKIRLPFPLILKLENKHASAGITGENVVHDKVQLTKVAAKLLNNYHTTILAEEFLDGEEYAAMVWGNGNDASCMYITKERYLDKSISIINTETAKFIEGSVEEKNLVPEGLDKEKEPNTYTKISRIAVDSYKALEFQDYGRFELRKRGDELFILDCNANPWIGIGAIIFKGTQDLGLNYGQTLLQICKFAVKRYMHE